MSGKYHPQTANEAGGLRREFVAFVGKRAAELETERLEKACTPSKPCPVARPKEIGSSTLVNEHCYCVTEYSGFSEDWFPSQRCCWCHNYEDSGGTYQPVPGHGPYRTELKRE